MTKLEKQCKDMADVCEDELELLTTLKCREGQNLLAERNEYDPN